MPRRFAGGTDQLSWPPHPGINATKPRPITLVGWATDWHNNAINDRFLINKADFNHQKGEFSVFDGAYSPARSTNTILGFWHNPWNISNARWYILAPTDDNWHMWSIRYNPQSLAEVPDMRFDTTPGTVVSDIANQPSGDYLVEAPPFSGWNNPTYDNTNPVPFNLDIGNTANSGYSSWNGNFWRFCWWDRILTDKELRDVYMGKRPDQIHFKNLLFWAELDGEPFEEDKGSLKMGYARISGTQKSVNAPLAYYTPRSLGVGLRKPLMEKGFSPSGTVVLTGMGMTAGLGGLVANPITKPLTGVEAAAGQGGVTPRIVMPLGGQPLTTGQGAIGPLKAPKIVGLSGISLSSAAGTVGTGVTESLAGQSMQAQQGGVNSGFTSVITLSGQQMSVAAGSISGAPSPELSAVEMLAIQGQLYIDAETEFLSQSWTKVEGPP